MGSPSWVSARFHEERPCAHYDAAPHPYEGDRCVRLGTQRSEPVAAPWAPSHATGPCGQSQRTSWSSSVRGGDLALVPWETRTLASGSGYR